MSKLGKKPIPITEGVKAELKDGKLEFTGKQGVMSVPVLQYVKIEIKDGAVAVSAEAGHVQARANWGTMASLIRNAILGVSEGFSKNLEIDGIGFKAGLDGQTLVLSVGFTHPVKFVPPASIKVVVEKNIIKVSGVDKNLVGQVAAHIRKIKKPEPYKGKGIHYVGEVIRRKAGKKVAGTGTTA